MGLRSESALEADAADVAKGLPLPRLSKPPATTGIYCSVTPVDVNGRLADRKAMQALGWRPNLPISLAWQEGIVIVKASKKAAWKITQHGYLLLPSSVRRSCGIEPADRVLVCAYLTRESLVVYTMGFLESMVDGCERETKAG
ncbi:hypothetical protein [Micromonospora aurantiaca (nom. illeg.)]|uniref:hypothetical protein n=1 Tax=Micromonospora aurantiaca (nom. illeg.) TaxID=47850 RepID=UPI0033C8D947